MRRRGRRAHPQMWPALEVRALPSRRSPSLTQECGRCLAAARPGRALWTIEQDLALLERAYWAKLQGAEDCLSQSQASQAGAPTSSA